MKCVNCDNNSFYECDNIQSYGGAGPDLLPGTGMFSHANFSLRICSSCGYIHWFVDKRNLHRIQDSRKFTLREYDEDNSMG